MKSDTDTVTLSRHEFEDLLVYAERYACGRKTFAPKDVCDLINLHLPNLTCRVLSVMIRDIEENKERDYLGDPRIDKPVWLATLKSMKAELKGRIS